MGKSVFDSKVLKCGQKSSINTTIQVLFSNGVFLQNKNIFDKTKYAMFVRIHYPFKLKSMSEIDFSTFATDFDFCLIFTDSPS